jgi:ABC-type transport system involved in cytochrome bd biosynthesis fused ATPase/permease subunit
MVTAISEVSEATGNGSEIGVEPAPAPATIDPVAEVRDLRVTFRRNGKDVHALRGVSLSIAKGEIVGLVGESGSGKSVLGFSMLALLPDHAKTTGTVRVAGADMIEGSPKALRKVRSWRHLPGSDDVAEPDHADRQAGRRSCRQ